MTNSLDAVYYAGPTFGSGRSLTLLGLVFDHLHFPGLYIPQSGLDKEATAAEIKRIQGLQIKGRNKAETINSMILALNAEHLADFCIFTGKPGIFGDLELGTSDLTKLFEELLFGPPPPDFFPSYDLGFNQGVPGDNTQINGPSWLSYPPNAVLYAIRKNLILVNDDRYLPVPAVGNPSLKHNAQLLATIMALESAKLVLPNIRTLTF